MAARAKRRARRNERPNAAGHEANALGSAAAQPGLATVFLIAVATFLVYSNSFHASFHLDDFSTIVWNRGLRRVADLWPPSGNRYVGYLSFALNYWAGGIAVFGYHLANVFIHFATATLVAWLSATTLSTPRLTALDAGALVRRYLPITAALLFAVHPVQTQAVTYIVQRFASLATFFYVLAVLLYAKARLAMETTTVMNRWAALLYFLALGSAVAAVKTKEISFTLPVAIAAYEALFFHRWRRLLFVIPFAGVSLLIPMALASSSQGLTDVLAEATHLAAETQQIPRSVYLLTETRVLVTYLRLLLIPVGQNLDYDYRLSHSISEPAVLLSIAILSSVCLTAVVQLRRALRVGAGAGVLIFFGIAWFFVALSVESSIIPIRDVIFEHRLYLPSVGAAIALGAGLLKLVEALHLRPPPTLQVGCALLMTVGPLGIAAHQRNLVWKDDVTLWSDVVAKSPGKARTHNNLAYAYQGAGRIGEAEHEAREAIRLDPRLAEAHNNLGYALQSAGRMDDALKEFREAIRLRPSMAEAHNNLAFALHRIGRDEDAALAGSEAVRLDPTLPDAHNNLGNAYQALGRREDAVREYRESVRLSPGFADAHYNLANAYQSSGAIDEAIAEFRIALQLRPQFAQAHNNLGIGYRAKGQLDSAIFEYREAIRLDPGLAIAHNNLGAVLQDKGLVGEALREYREAVRIDPGLTTARQNVDVLLRARPDLVTGESR